MVGQVRICDGGSNLGKSVQGRVIRTYRTKVKSKQVRASWNKLREVGMSAEKLDLGRTSLNRFLLGATGRGNRLQQAGAQWGGPMLIWAIRIKQRQIISNMIEKYVSGMKDSEQLTLV